MEIAQPAAPPRRSPPPLPPATVDADQLRLKKQTIRTLMEQLQQSLAQFPGEDADEDGAGEAGSAEDAGEAAGSDHEVDECKLQLCDLIKSKVDSPAFLEKFGSIRKSVSQDNSDNCASWDIVTTTDLWEHKLTDGANDSDEDNYVLVNREDIADGMACFVAAYLLSLEQTKEITPNQLQEVLRKTFSAKKKKGKLHKAWDGSKVIYNVASWGATAIGLYQNPAVVKAATVAFWSSCRVISKLL